MRISFLFIRLNELGRVSNSPSKKFENSAYKIQSKKNKGIKVSSLIPIRVNLEKNINCGNCLEFACNHKQPIWDSIGGCWLDWFIEIVQHLHEAKMFFIMFCLFPIICCLGEQSSIQTTLPLNLPLSSWFGDTITFSICTWNDKRDRTLILRTSYAWRLALDYEARWW